MHSKTCFINNPLIIFFKFIQVTKHSIFKPWNCVRCRIGDGQLGLAQRDRVFRRRCGCRRPVLVGVGRCTRLGWIGDKNGRAVWRAANVASVEFVAVVRRKHAQHDPTRGPSRAGQVSRIQPTRSRRLTRRQPIRNRRRRGEDVDRRLYHARLPIGDWLNDDVLLPVSHIFRLERFGGKGRQLMGKLARNDNNGRVEDGGPFLQKCTHAGVQKQGHVHKQ